MRRSTGAFIPRSETMRKAGITVPAFSASRLTSAIQGKICRGSLMLSMNGRRCRADGQASPSRSAIINKRGYKSVNNRAENERLFVETAYRRKYAVREYEGRHI